MQTRPKITSDVVILAVLTAPFLLNDFANIHVHDCRLWVAIDYVFAKTLPVGCLIYFERAKRISYADIGFKFIAPVPMIVLTIVMTMAGIILDQYSGRLLSLFLPYGRLGGMPPIPNPVLRQIDLYFGLGMVGIIEEVVFRGLYDTVLSRYLRQAWTVFLAIMFGLIHWSGGVTMCVHAALIGFVFMFSMSRFGSVLPTIIAHFVVNYVAFGLKVRA